MINFQEKALQEREDRIFTETYLKNKKYDKIFFRLGIVLILILCALVGYIDFTSKLVQPETVQVQIQAKPQIPEILSINGEEWRLEPATGEWKAAMDSVDALSLTLCDQKYILYRPDSADIRNNLWHEVFHAAGCLHGGDSWWNSPSRKYIIRNGFLISGPHPGIYHLAQFLDDFDRTNKDFIEWEENDVP